MSLVRILRGCGVACRRAAWSAGLAALLAVRSGPGFAAGTTAAGIMTEPMGARPLAMASSYVSLADDSLSLFYNPAGLGRVRRSQIASDFQQGLADTSLSSVYLARPFEHRGGLGLGVTRLDVGKVQVYNEDGSETTVKAQEDLLVSLGYGLATSPTEESWGRFGAGATFKYYQSTLVQQARASGWACDFGGLWETPWRVNLGASLANLGPGVGYSGGLGTGETAPLPRTLRVGADAYLPLPRSRERVLLALEFDKAVDQSLKTSLGLEYDIVRFLSLRAGYKLGEALGSFTTGVGLRLGAVRFDYGFGLMSAVNNRNSFSLSMEFGRTVERISSEEVESDRRERVSRFPDELFRQGQYFSATRVAEGSSWLPKSGETLQKIREWVSETLKQGQYSASNRFYYAAAYRSRFGGRPLRQVVADLEEALAHDMNNEELIEELGRGRKEAAKEEKKSVERAAELYQQALRRYEVGKYEAAITLLREALQRNSSHASALKLLDLAIQGSANAAMERVRRTSSAQASQTGRAKLSAPKEPVGDFDPKKAEQLYLEGLFAYSDKQYQKAVSLFQEALKYDPFHMRARNALERVRKDVR